MHLIYTQKPIVPQINRGMRCMENKHRNKEKLTMSNNNKKIEAGRRSARNKVKPEQNNIIENTHKPTVKRVI